MTVTANGNARARLAEIRERTKAARTQRQRAKTTLDAARGAGDDQAAAIATLALDAAAVELETAEQLESMLLSSMAGVTGVGLGGETFLDNPQTVQTLEQLAHSSAPIGSVMLGSYMSAEAFADSIGPGRPRAGGEDQPGLSGKRQTIWGPIVRQVYRPLTLLDLIPSGTMDGSAIEYVVELGDLDDAAETEEGAVKPEDTTTEFEEAVAPARTIAVWIKQRRQVLADVPELASVLSSRLQYKVQRRLEQQILIGDGVGQNLLGLLNQTGIGSVGPDPAIPLSDLLLKGKTATLMADAVPNGIVLHPYTHEALLTEKTSTGERLDSDGAFSSDGQVLWDLPIIDSKVIPQTSALVGDFSLACSLLIREGVNLRISDADQDDFVRNRVTLLAEMRAALPVWQPAALTEVLLA
jgi:HK97 family phage major capsid protein